MTPPAGSGAALDWIEVADRILVWRQPLLDVNAVLVVGTTGALVVDTLSSPRQAAELAAAVRRVTPLPWRVANTHHHFDHCFGNATLAPDPTTEVWAHTECVARYARHTGTDSAIRARIDGVVAEYAERLPELAAEVAEVTLRGPDRSVADRVVLDLGDRKAELRHLGRGHTDNDLVVVVPDADVVLAGDLVEEGAPPSFDDSWPLEWAGTVAALLDLGPDVVVPGHGGPLPPSAVADQHAGLVHLEWTCRQGWDDHAPAEEVAEEVAAHAFLDRATALLAVERAYAFLDGRL